MSLPQAYCAQVRGYGLVGNVNTSPALAAYKACFAVLSKSGKGATPTDVVVPVQVGGQVRGFIFLEHP